MTAAQAFRPIPKSIEERMSAVVSDLFEQYKGKLLIKKQETAILKKYAPIVGEKATKDAIECYKIAIVKEPALKVILDKAVTTLKNVDTVASEWIAKEIKESKYAWVAMKDTAEKARGWSVDTRNTLIEIFGKEIPLKYLKPTAKTAIGMGAAIVVTYPILYLYAAYEQKKGEKALREAEELKKKTVTELMEKPVAPVETPPVAPVEIPSFQAHINIYGNAMKAIENLDPKSKTYERDKVKYEKAKDVALDRLEEYFYYIREYLQTNPKEYLEKIKEATNYIISKDRNIAQAFATSVGTGLELLYKNRITHAEARELLDKLIKNVPEMDAKAAENLFGVAYPIYKFSSDENSTKLEKSEGVEDLKKLLDVAYTKGPDSLLSGRALILYEISKLDEKEAEKEIVNIIIDNRKKEIWKFALTLYKLDAITDPVVKEIIKTFLEKYPQLNELMSK